MSRRLSVLLTLVLVAGMTGAGLPSLSSATFTSTTAAHAGVTAAADWTAPTVALRDPGGRLSGTVTVTADATDAESGIRDVTIEGRTTGTTTWTTLCTDPSAPYACSFDTTLVANGAYDLRATATDRAGHRTTSPTITATVDNRPSVVFMEDPGAWLSGTLTLRATAESGAGITSVRIQGSPAGAATWVDICAGGTAPYGCTFDTTAMPDGLYDLRAALVDGSGRETVSTVVGDRRVDNTPLRGLDVQAVNGSGQEGRPDSGDVVSLTYSKTVDLTSISPGWEGSPLPVQVRLRNGEDLDLKKNDDTLDVAGSGAVVNLGSVNLQQNYVDKKPAVFEATITASMVSVDGVPGTQVRLTLGSVVSGTTRRATSPSAMVWTPSGLARDLSGGAASTTPVTETGPSDRNF